MDNSIKAMKVIDAALDRYRPAAVEKVREEHCTECPDKRCERGLPCHYFGRLVRAIAWDMVEAKDN